MRRDVRFYRGPAQKVKNPEKQGDNCCGLGGYGGDQSRRDEQSLWLRCQLGLGWDKVLVPELPPGPWSCWQIVTQGQCANRPRGVPRTVLASEEEGQGRTRRHEGAWSLFGSLPPPPLSLPEPQTMAVPLVWGQLRMSPGSGSNSAQSFPRQPLAQRLGTFLQHQECTDHPSSPRPRGLAPSSPAHPGKRSTSFEYSFRMSSRPRRTCHDTLIFSRFSTFSLGVDTEAKPP